MNNTELANLITERFMPFVFKCDCKGADPDCAEALSDPKVWAQQDTVYRIAKYITNLGDSA